jgi:Putative peptidoglycan binding domain/HlyD family secretion protein
VIIRRRRAVLTGVIIVAAIGLGIGIGQAAGRSAHGPATGTGGGADGTSLARVSRGVLTAQTSVTGTLGYAGSYTVVNQARGTITGLPPAGRVIRQGASLYHVDQSPVLLLYGRIPAYRTLGQGTSGADVRALNHDLVGLGYAARAQFTSGWAGFTAATASAVSRLQARAGLPPTGTLPLGQVVFLPSAARVAAVSATLGATARPGQPVLTATTTTRQVSISLDAAEQSYVRPGDQVTITLPDQQTTPGRVSAVGKVATTPRGSGSSGAQAPVIAVAVTPLDPGATGRLDQAPVQVSITTASVRNALAVPVDALLARSTGGYWVEVAEPGGAHRLVRVTLGLFDDAAGLVQVTGAGLADGQRVVVPAL